VELLLRYQHKNVNSIVALSRQSPTPSNEPRLSHLQIEYANPASLEKAFSGLDTLVFPGSNGNPEEMLLHHRNVLAAASKCHVRRFVYLSTLDVSPSSRFPYAKVHQATEKMLAETAWKCAYCVLRSSPSPSWTCLSSLQLLKKFFDFRLD
jgi:NAD(P)H dehydrogenase (quinone)